MKKTHDMKAVSYDFAAQLVERAMAAGKEQQTPVTVAVVDPALQLVAFGKSDGATAHSGETARRKANTAASTKKASGWMTGELVASLPQASNNLLTNVPGGFPIGIDGVVVGGLGVAGGSTEEDAAIASATLKSDTH